MNIFIVTHEIAPEIIGGSETQTLGLAKELAKTNQVTVFTRIRSSLSRIETRSQFLVKRLGRKHRFPIPIFSWVVSFLYEVFKARKIVDLLFAKSITFGFISGIAKIIFKIPVVVLIEGVQEYRNKTLFNQLMLRFVLKNTRVIVQTRSIQKDLLNKTGAKASVIPNGVYLSNEIAKGIKVIFVGRLVRDKMGDKGVRYLIDAVKNQKIDTLIIGEGPELENLKKRAGGAENIIFTGKILPDEVIGYLKQGLALVLPSLYGEGLPNVILEAMAVGLPVIATRTAGIQDVIQHEQTGLLIQPGNVEEIRKAVHILKQDVLLWNRMSENCRRSIQEYDWKIIARKFENYFKETIRS